MRTSLKVIIWAHVLLALFLAYCTLDLMALPLQNWHRHVFSAEDVDPSKNSSSPQKPMIIPKIIHQTYKDENIPDIWKEGQKSCKELHPDYKYILWTDKMAREFIAKEYPWFLKTWDGYKYPIERADTIRYFVLAHYGGVYIDLDDGCQRKLDPLLTVPAFVRETTPNGVSNDVMGAVPGHPFFVKVFNNLQKYNRNWIVPYITIMFSTGPLFLSVILEKYNWGRVPDDASVTVLLPKDYRGSKDSFFKIAPGSSWHMGDAHFIKTLGHHIPLAVFSGFMIAGLIFLMEWYIYQFCIRTNFHRVFDYILYKIRPTRGFRGRPRKDSNLTANPLLGKNESMV